MYGPHENADIFVGKTKVEGVVLNLPIRKKNCLLT